MVTYSFNFREKIPDKEIQKIILITKSGNSYNGELSKKNEKSQFSLMNVFIFSSIFLYIPLILRFQFFWKNIDNIFYTLISKILDLFPINENSSPDTILTYFFTSITISIICLVFSITILYIIFYQHLKIVYKCSQWANQKFVFYKLKFFTNLFTKIILTICLIIY